MCDHGRVDAFAAHGLLELVHDKRAVARVVECLKVIVHVLAGGAFMRDDDDALVARLFQHGVTRRGVDRNNAECLNVLIDDVLDDLHLLCGIRCNGALLVGVDAGVGGKLIDALLHAREPAVRRVLDDDRDLPVLLVSLLCGFACVNHLLDLAAGGRGLLSAVSAAAAHNAQTEHQPCCDSGEFL